MTMGEEAVLAEGERALAVVAEIAGDGRQGVGRKGDWTSGSATRMAGKAEQEDERELSST
jgi:hypothetical protein